MKMLTTLESPHTSLTTHREDPLVTRLVAATSATRCVCLSLRSENRSSDEVNRLTTLIQTLSELEEELLTLHTRHSSVDSVSAEEILRVLAFELDVIGDRCQLSKIHDDADTLVCLVAELCRMLADIYGHDDPPASAKGEFIALADLVSCDALYLVTRSGTALREAA